MSKISYARHLFAPSTIQRAAWLYFRFPLSFCGVGEMLANRRVDISYETIRRWILKFGPAIANKKLSREFGPVVKVDQLVGKMIQTDETKEPLA